MNRRLLMHGIWLALCVLLVSCSASPKRKNGTSTVSLTVSSGSGMYSAPTLSTGLPTLSLVFTISASDMDTISKTVSVTPPATITETFDVPNGTARTFLLEAKDSRGSVLDRGSTTADLDGTAVALSMEAKQIYTKLIGTQWIDKGKAIARDGSGNIVIAGTTYGDLDGNVNSNPLNATSDAFVTKFYATGVAPWTRLIGTVGTDVANGVATDTSGNIFVVGTTDGNLDGQTNTGLSDCFVTKLDANGNTLWTRLLGSTENDFGKAIAVDAGGNVYVAGYTYGSLVTSLGTFTNAGSAGTSDIFVAEFDTSGTLLWADQRGTPYNEQGEGLAVDSSGNVYLAGFTFGDLDGNTNGSLVKGTTSDLFLIKYDATHAWQWTRQLGTQYNENAWAVAVDISGNAYVAGGTEGNLDGYANAGPLGTTSDIFVVKYDTNGNKQWTRLTGSSGDDVAHGIAYASGGTLTVTGRTTGGLDGNTNAGATDIVVVRYDTAGNMQWTRQIGTEGSDEGNGVVTDDSGYIFLTGTTTGNLDGVTNSGYTDAFLMQYDGSGVKQ